MSDGDFKEKLKQGFEHAFSIENVNALTEAEKKLVEMTADAVVERGMEAPALMLLESCRPLGALSSGAAAFLEPILASFVSAEKLEVFLRLMERKNAIEMLIETIEKQSKSR